MVAAASYGIVDHDRKHDNQSPSLQEGDAAIKALCGVKTGVSSDILFPVTRKKDINITLPVCARTQDYSLDFSNQRKMASAELAARGFTGYDPKAYY